jgi:phosphate transport system permease protein
MQKIPWVDEGMRVRLLLVRPMIDVLYELVPHYQKKLEKWSPTAPLPWYAGITDFFGSGQWLTASSWQDHYGILPLLVGSLLISAVALLIAVPLGVGAGIYINQIATPWEQAIVKPAIEFISAIPSVVLGFFGVAILGEGLRETWHGPVIGWLYQVTGWSFFAPFSERLNILTAGILLAFMAVPTIFTLTEDAINNVPRSFKEASFALGATRLQTIWRIILPASLSGVISAVLLGFGRVIGETMVVLLCAGNRIAIPPLSDGLAIVFEPVHTMTGIIAQELGEVEQGGIHWHALFTVGLLLFLISLVINFFAQRIVQRFKISIG